MWVNHAKIFCCFKKSFWRVGTVSPEFKCVPIKLKQNQSQVIHNGVVSVYIKQITSYYKPVVIDGQFSLPASEIG